MNETMKLCKDCRWMEPVDPPPPIRMPRCMHASAAVSGQPDYVWGQQLAPQPLLCELMRDDPARCGPEGRHWEPP